MSLETGLDFTHKGDPWPRPTKFISKPVDDGTTNVMACKFTIKPSTNLYVNELKVRDRNYQLKMERKTNGEKNGAGDEMIFPDADAVLVCEGEEFPINRNYSAHFSSFLQELFSKDRRLTKFVIETCTAEEMKYFLSAVNSIIPPSGITTIAANQKLRGAEFMQYEVELIMIWCSYYNGMECAFEKLEFARKHGLELLEYTAVTLIQIEDFKDFKELFDKLDEETKKICEERRVELEERKKDKRRERKEMKEWKKKKEEERKKREKMTQRKENRKEKKEKEKEKKRIRKEKKKL